jgi:adrenodoxin-NADP+ reductase
MLTSISLAKNCQEKFSEVAMSSRFNFVGNIELGSALPLRLIKPHYDALLFAYGASKDKELGVPGEKDVRGIYSARAFVGWYNGLPEYRDLDPDLTSGEDAVIVGHGNVGLDVARTLLTDIDILRKTDMSEYALAELAKSTIRRVSVVGRRGPMQVRLF